MRDFLFAPEQAEQPVSALSGGERGRLMLARALAAPSNLLVLDEPTNDLDLETLDLLQEMIADYAGTVILVSHDRDFLDRTVTSIVAAEGDGRWLEYAGGYSDMLAQRGSAPLFAPAKLGPRARGTREASGCPSPRLGIEAAAELQGQARAGEAAGRDRSPAERGGETLRTARRCNLLRKRSARLRRGRGRPESRRGNACFGRRRMAAALAAPRRDRRLSLARQPMLACRFSRSARNPRPPPAKASLGRHRASAIRRARRIGRPRKAASRRHADRGEARSSCAPRPASRHRSRPQAARRARGSMPAPLPSDPRLGQDQAAFLHPPGLLPKRLLDRMRPGEREDATPRHGSTAPAAAMQNPLTPAPP